MDAMRPSLFALEVLLIHTYCTMAHVNTNVGRSTLYSWHLRTDLLLMRFEDDS